MNNYGLDPYRHDKAPNQAHINFVKSKYPIARYYIPETGRSYIYSPVANVSDGGPDTYYGGPSANNRHDAWQFAAEELGYE